MLRRGFRRGQAGVRSFSRSNRQASTRYVPMPVARGTTAAMRQRGLDAALGSTGRRVVMRAKSMSRVAVALLLAISASTAQATFHLIKVVEVFPGTPADPAAQYVVIQMYAAGQEFVGTQ